MVATELILGMEELVNHIRELGEENKKLEEENKKLKEPMVEELEDYLEMNGAEGGIIKTQHERDFYKKKVEELKEENKKLKQYQPKGSQIDPEGLHDYMKEEIDRLKEQNKKLQEYKDLEKDILVSDVNEKQDKISLLEAENKKLKEDLDDKEHWNQTMVSYMDDGDGWCHFDRWLGENIDEDDKKQEWVKEWMENTEYEDSDSP